MPFSSYSKKFEPPLPPDSQTQVGVVLLVGVTGASLWFQGSGAAPAGARIFEIIGEADGYDAMIHGSLAALTASVLLVLLTLFMAWVFTKETEPAELVETQ